MEIRGIHLTGEEFKAEYNNTSSETFKEMTLQKEYQLWVLTMVNGMTNVIRGGRVVFFYQRQRFPSFVQARRQGHIDFIFLWGGGALA